MGTLRAVAGLVAGAIVMGLGAGNRVQPVLAQISDRPSQQPFVARPGTAVPRGIEVLRVWNDVYMVAGAGGNVVVQTGPQGIFLIDTGATGRSADVLGAVTAISDGVIRYIANTTPDADHYGGNDVVSKAGLSPTVPAPDLAGTGALTAPAGGDPRVLLAMVLAHEGTLNRLSASSGGSSPAPFDLWPTNTFFTPDV